MASDMLPDGSCPDCGHIPQIGEWPYCCYGDGHVLYMALAFWPGGRKEKYAPAYTHYVDPIKAPEVTRDWMDADGSIRPMKEDEWVKDHVPGLDK